MPLLLLLLLLLQLLLLQRELPQSPPSWTQLQLLRFLLQLLSPSLLLQLQRLPQLQLPRLPQLQ